MSLEEKSRATGTAAALRHGFDRSFAEGPTVGSAASEDFLAIRIGGDPYALRVSDIAGLHADRKIVRIPSPEPTLLGIASFRGAMAPVFDLRLVLGYASGAAPRWLVLVRGPALVGLAFDLFEAHLRAVGESTLSLDSEERAPRHLRGVIRTTEVARPLIHIASVIEAISRQVSKESPPKEL
jgi:purine-binding chemotaxis protein CheW